MIVHMLNVPVQTAVVDVNVDLHPMRVTGILKILLRGDTKGEQCETLCKRLLIKSGYTVRYYRCYGGEWNNNDVRNKADANDVKCEQRM